MDTKMLSLAARNLAGRLGVPPRRKATIMYSLKKRTIALAVSDELASRGIRCSLIDLSSCSQPQQTELQSEMRQSAGQIGILLFLSPEHFPFMLGSVGRPDQRLKLRPEHVFCDFGFSLEGLMRIYAVDLAEVEAFRNHLLANLKNARRVRVVTSLGTDIAIQPRHWNSSPGEIGEIFTAPVEGIATGKVVIDGCAYFAPAKRPFTLVFEKGRVTNLHELDPSDEQQAMALSDFSRDPKMPVLAEFGIGINPGARWDADVMEAEQARGTCHFGFGHNTEYGGANTATYHFDLVVRCPEIIVDGITLELKQQRPNENPREDFLGGGDY